MASLEDALKLIGALLGIVAFLWNVWGSMRSYLVLKIEVRDSQGFAPMIKVSISNSGMISKMISYAALVLSPESITLTEAARRLNGDANGKSNALVRLYRKAGDEPASRNGCTLIPLRELYQDQFMVGPGENVSYTCSLHLPYDPELQVVRFIVFIAYAGLYVRWRYTAEAVRVSGDR